MRTKTYLINYTSILTPLARDCADLDQDPDCIYAKKDPLVPTWQSIDDKLKARLEIEDDSDATETETTTRKGKERATFLSSLSRSKRKREQEAARVERMRKEHHAAAEAASLAVVVVDGKQKKPRRTKVIASSPIGAVKDDAFNRITEAYAIKILMDSPEASRSEEVAAAKRLGLLRYFFRMVRQPVLDAILFRPPPVFNYNPLVIGDQTTRRDIVENLQKAASVVVMMEPRHIAEEMTNIMKVSFLRIQVSFL